MDLSTAPKAVIRELAFDYVEVRLNVDRLALESHRRQAPLVVARALFVWIMRTHRAVSYPLIGRWLGGRDHTTIIHLQNKAIDLCRRDATFARHCEQFAAFYHANQGGHSDACD